MALSPKRIIFAIIFIALIMGLTGFAYKTAQASVALDVDGKITKVNFYGSKDVEEILDTELKDRKDIVVSHSPSEKVTDGDQVKVRYKKEVKVIADGVEATKTIPASTYEEALKETNTKVQPGAFKSFKEDEIIPRAGDTLVISSEKEIALSIGGKEEKVITNAPTVEALLEEKDIALEDTDELNHSPETYLRDETKVELTKVLSQSVTEEVSIPLPVKRQDDDSLLEGETKVLEKGSDKVVEKEWAFTYANDKIRERKLLGEKVVSKGKARVIAIGTAPLYPEVEPGSAKAIAQKLMEAYDWDGNEFKCLDGLWERESNWNYRAENPSSGAYGIPQSLPGNKMATAGDDWRTNPETQIKWGLGYIKDRYGTPCEAKKHSNSVGWY